MLEEGRGSAVRVCVVFVAPQEGCVSVCGDVQVCGVGLCVGVKAEVSSHTRFAVLRNCAVCACPSRW